MVGAEDVVLHIVLFLTLTTKTSARHRASMLKGSFCFAIRLNHADPGQLEVDEGDGDGGADASEAAGCACQSATFDTLS